MPDLARVAAAMPFSSVVAQPRVVETLRSAMASGRVAHAYLFHGPSGSGKRAAGVAFAAALLCEARPDGSGDACGACGACQKVARGVHPDLHVLLPTPSDVDADDLAERLKRLADDPYVSVDYARRPTLGDPEKTSNKQVLYSVERMQEDVRRPMAYRPTEGRVKVALLASVDVMRVEAANAFLKLLEEPGEHTVFVLTTERLDRVLPTIVSRCQQVRFDPLPDEAVAAALVARGRADGARAEALARMAGGSLTAALDLAEQGDLLGRRDLVVRFVRHAYAPRPENIGVIDTMAGLGREPLKNALDLLLRWIHDLLRFRTLGDPAALVNRDIAESITLFVEKVPRANLEAMVTLVEEARDLLERNVSSALVVRVLAIQLRTAMRSGRHVPLYTPLAEILP